MPKLKIELVDVYCNDTEDTVMRDDFYLVGALAGGETTKAILTRPIKIFGRETKQFRPEDVLLFEGEIPQRQSVKGGLNAYDQDVQKDWAKYGDTIKEISNSVSSVLAAAGPQGATPGQILSAATKPVGILGTLDKWDKDDLLGTTELEISGTGPALEERTWKMSGKSSAASTWDYAVRYRIQRS